MHYITCIVRLADAFTDRKKRILTPNAVELANRSATELLRIVSRFGTDLYHSVESAESAKVIASVLNAQRTCILVMPKAVDNLSGDNVWPFIDDLSTMTTGMITWFGVTIMVTEYAFIQEAFLSAVNYWGYKRQKGLKQTFPYGSILLLKNGKEKTVSILLND